MNVNMQSRNNATMAGSDAFLAEVVVTHAETTVEQDRNGLKHIVMEVGSFLDTADPRQRKIVNKIRLRMPTDTAEKLAKKLLADLGTIPPRERMDIKAAMASPGRRP